MSGDDEDDEVGYGRPPKEHRFKPGRSGNPRGRPPRSRNLKKIIGEEFDRVIPGAGQRPSMSARQLMVRGMIARATKGSVPAAEWLMKHGPTEGGFLDGFF